MAAMHACGPYVIENVVDRGALVYTNNQPSGSIRAPTAPQTCWAVEQHMDEVAAALDMDPVELRRRTLIDEGDESPTRQVFEPLGIRETLERAVEMIGYGAELPEDEAIGVAVGWWPCMPAPSGAYVKLNADGSGTIVTGAQENGSGAVMGLPLIAAQVLGMRPERLLDPLPGHRRRSVGQGLVRIADDVQQRPGGHGGRRARSATSCSSGGRAAGDRSRRPGARRRHRPRQGLTGEVGADRRSGRRDRDRPREGVGRGPRGADGRHAAAASAGSAWSRSSSRS